MSIVNPDGIPRDELDDAYNQLCAAGLSESDAHDLLKEFREPVNGSARDDLSSRAKRFVEARCFIAKRHKEAAIGGFVGNTLAHTLELNIKNLFSSGNKFIYELLQNADDAEATKVDFTLRGSTLIISHDGNHFSRDDVNKLCDNAQPTGEKIANIDCRAWGSSPSP
jgi:hypothetical protein